MTTLAVNIATSNGLVCVTSAGNSGHDTDPLTSNLGASADAFDVLTIGASDSAGVVASFSSNGPSADGRVKPELHARGVGARTVCAFTDIGCTTGISGTSFSGPITAGMVACLLQAHPTWTVGQLRQRLFRTGDYFLTNGTSDPEFVLGYGIPDADVAAFDCNANGVNDVIDLSATTSCDCNANGWPDECDILDGISVDGDLDGRPDECTASLAASPTSLSLASGGVQAFCLDAGSGFADQAYILLGSMSGITPGLTFGALHLPLNPDAYFVRSMRRSVALTGSLGVLDAQGHATASLAIPAGAGFYLAGTTLHHAFVAFPLPGASSPGPDHASSAPVGGVLVSDVVSLELLP